MAIKVSYNNKATAPKSILASHGGVVTKVKQVFASHLGAARKVWPAGADGSTWVSQSAPDGYQWGYTCYGKGLFVALANTTDALKVADYFMSSTDGATWTLRPISNPGNISGICFADAIGLFLMTTRTSGRIMTSTDGITWNKIDILQSSAQTHNPCYGNGVALARVGSGMGTYLRSSSPNSNNWEQMQLPGSWDATNFCFGNGKFIVLSQTGNAATSTNGIDWTLVTGAPQRAWVSVCYGNGIYVALNGATSGNRIATSSDGLSWTIRTTPSDSTNNMWMSICFGNGVFVAVAGSGTGDRVMTSTDGITWATHAAAVNNAWMGVCYGVNKFVAVASTGSGNRVMTSG